MESIKLYLYEYTCIRFLRGSIKQNFSSILSMPHSALLSLCKQNLYQNSKFHSVLTKPLTKQIFNYNLGFIRFSIQRINQHIAAPIRLFQDSHTKQNFKLTNFTLHSVFNQIEVSNSFTKILFFRKLPTGSFGRKFITPSILIQKL